MAYLIVDNQNGLYKIAANDTDKNNLNCTFPPFTTIDISDADFLKIKQELVYINISNGSATFTDKVFSNVSLIEENILPYHKMIIEEIKNFLDKNPSNGFYTRCNNYLNYLETLNYSSISFPIDKSWENYCEENSIPYLHPLQIP